MRREPIWTAAPIDVDRSHAARLGADAVKGVCRNMAHLADFDTKHLSRFFIGDMIWLEAVRLVDGDDVVEGEAVM